MGGSGGKEGGGGHCTDKGDVVLGHGVVESHSDVWWVCRDNHGYVLLEEGAEGGEDLSLIHI